MVNDYDNLLLFICAKKKKLVLQMMHVLCKHERLQNFCNSFF